MSKQTQQSGSRGGLDLVSHFQLGLSLHIPAASRPLWNEDRHRAKPTADTQ